MDSCIYNVNQLFYTALQYYVVLTLYVLTMYDIGSSHCVDLSMTTTLDRLTYTITNKKQYSNIALKRKFILTHN